MACYGSCCANTRGRAREARGRPRSPRSASGRIALPLLPPSTNAQYHGARGAAHVLTAVGVLTLVPGLLHTFLPDGGAGVIAGLDLSRNGAVIVGAFAWAGATQIVWGILLVVASVRYRSLVPLLLALVLLERSLMAANLWWLKPSGGSAHPPGAYGVLIALPILAAACFASLRGAGATRAPASPPSPGPAA